MSATPADIAAFTVDGIVITVQNSAIKTLIPDAKDLGDSEIEMFCDNQADGLTLLAERFAILGAVGAPHEGVEIEDSLAIGTTIPITPAVPEFTLVDESRALATTGRLRAFVDDRHTDRFSLELLG